MPQGADRSSPGAKGGFSEQGLEEVWISPGPGEGRSFGRAGSLDPTSTPPFQALELDSIRSHHWCIQGCSAVTGENLLPGIDWLLDDISSRIFTAD